MKKILTILYLLLSLSAFSQTHVAPVTKFLGISVDGFKTQMIQKLKDKGFSYNSVKECLTGEFNGRDVEIYVITNNNKVWRLMIRDAFPSSETDIKIRFNTLCAQFAKNTNKYMQANMGLEEYTIPEEEDISYNMSVKNKRYEASFWQITEKIDSTTFKDEATKLVTKYGEIKTDSITEEEKKDIQVKVIADVFHMLANRFSKNSVWFMISKDDAVYSDYERPYRILMYYDNENNHSNGEDL
jgi:hypothetical protein